MTKIQFLMSLHSKLMGLPQDEVEERLSFYSEMIEDRMEEGLSEDEAVSAIGTVDKIVEEIIGEIPLSKIAKEKIKPKRRMKAWEVVLLILGSPLWISLILAAFAVVLAIYASLWSVIVSLWAVFASIAGCAFGGVTAGPILALIGYMPAGILMLCAGMVCAGFSIFLFFGCKAATKRSAWLTKKIAIAIKRCFMGREEA